MPRFESAILDDDHSSTPVGDSWRRRVLLHEELGNITLSHLPGFSARVSQSQTADPNLPPCWDAPALLGTPHPSTVAASSGLATLKSGCGRRIVYSVLGTTTVYTFSRSCSGRLKLPCCGTWQETEGGCSRQKLASARRQVVHGPLRRAVPGS